MTGQLVRAAVESVLDCLHGEVAEQDVTSRLAPRLLAQGDVPKAMLGASRFALFRSHLPVIESIEDSGPSGASAVVRTGPDRWQVEVAVQQQPPHLITRFVPRPIAADAAPWDGLSDRLRAADHAVTELPATAANAVRQRLLAEVQAHRIPALAAGFAVNGRIVHREFLGLADPAGTPVDATSVFRFGSIAKLVTALLVLSLVQDGALDLADVVAIRRAVAAGTPFAEAAQGVRLTVSPGKPEYSNPGYTILGAVAEAAGGALFAELARERVFRRFGMHGAAMQEPGRAAPVTVVGHRVTGDRLAVARRGVLRRADRHPRRRAGARHGLADGQDPLVRLALRTTGPSPVPPAVFCPGFAVTAQDLPTGRRPLPGRPTAWKEGATAGFTAELAATVDNGGEPLAIVVLAAKSPPDPFGAPITDLGVDVTT